MIRPILCAAVLALALMGCKSRTPTTPAAAPAAITVKAGDLMQAYGGDANALAADAKYKGKLLQVTGKLGSVQKAPLMGYVATLLPEDATDLNLAGVQCFLQESAEADAAQLQPGTIVTLQGTCDGQTLAQVKLSKCTVVK
jgi:hypothetical protein